MTIAAGLRTELATDGSSTDFTATFWVQDQESLGVTVFDPSDLTLTNQVLGTDYTVSIADGGGIPTITFLTAPDDNLTVILYPDGPLNQETSFGDGILDFEAIEDGMDLLAGNITTLRDLIGQSLRVPQNNPGIDAFDTAEDRASSFLYFDSNGDPVTKTVAEAATLISASATLPSSNTDEYELTDDGTAITGTDARVVARVLDERASILDFGGNRDGTTDNTAALTAAIAWASGGKRIILPPGAGYKLATVVNITSKCIIECHAPLIGTSGQYLLDLKTAGAGTEIHRLLAQFNGGNGIVFRSRGKILGGEIDLNTSYPINLSQGADRSLVRGLRFNGADATAIANAAIVCESSDDNEIYDCTFLDWFGFGCQVISAAASGHQVAQYNRFISNKHLSELYTETSVASGGQTVFDFTLDKACARYAVFDNGAVVIQTTDYAITDTPAGTANVNKRVTFTSGRTAGHTITLIGFRSLEAYNVNSRALDTYIENAFVNGTGDSCVAMGDDNATTGAKRTKVIGLTARNANYAAIAETDSDNTGGHYADFDIRDCALSRLSGADDIFSAGITLVGSAVYVGEGTIENVNSNNYMKYGIVFPGAAQVDSGNGIAPGAVITMPRMNESAFTRTIYMQQNSTSTLMEGIEMAGVEGVPYPGVPDLISAFTNYPSNTDWLTYTKSGATGWNQNATGIVGTKCATTVSGEYVDIAVKSNFFDRGLLVFNFQAKAASGSSYAKPVLTVASTAVVGTGRTITSTSRKNYKLRVPCHGIDAASVLKIRIGATSGTCDFDTLSFSYYPYVNI